MFKYGLEKFNKASTTKERVKKELEFPDIKKMRLVLNTYLVIYFSEHATMKNGLKKKMKNRLRYHPYPE